MTAQNAFKYFKTSPKIIRLAVMYYIRYPLSFRQVEDILHERGIDICHETVRFWVNRFCAKFAKEIRKKRLGRHSIGSGTRMKFSSKSTVEDFTFGAPLIMKAKFLNALLQNDATRLQRRSSL